MNDINQESRLLSRAMGGRIESRELPDGVYEHTVKAERMTWTTKYPETSGYYWVRNINAGSGIEVEPQVVFAGADKIISFTFLGNPAKHEIISAEWYGPLEPPE